jgi:hypothetical protein
MLIQQEKKKKKLLVQMFLQHMRNPKAQTMTNASPLLFFGQLPTSYFFLSLTLFTYIEPSHHGHATLKN